MNRTQLAAQLGSTILAIAACAGPGPPQEGPQPRPSTAPASPPPEVAPDDTYDSLQSLADAYRASGGKCTQWEEEVDPGADIQQLPCASDPDRTTSLYLATSTEAAERLPYAIQTQLETNRRVGHMVAFVVGDGWAISGEEDAMVIVQDKMGGFLRP